jgi:hypothetical protein
VSEQLTDSDLELIEARARYAAGVDSYVERWDLPSTGDDKIIIHRCDVLWMVEALRSARAEVEDEKRQHLMTIQTARYFSDEVDRLNTDLAGVRDYVEQNEHLWILDNHWAIGEILDRLPFATDPSDRPSWSERGA